MVFRPDPIAPPDTQFDNGVEYAADIPFSVKQTVVTHRRHRWFDVRTIGIASGPYAVTPGLTGGSTQRIAFDHKPDWIYVSISGQTAATGRVTVFFGEAGGPGILLGPTGYLCMPGPENGIVTLTNVGTTSTFGNVIAYAAYPGDISLYPGT